MNFTISVKPKKITSTTKNGLYSKLSQYGFTCFNKYSVGARVKDLRGKVTVTGLNFEKHRSKKSQISKTFKGKKGLPIRKTTIHKGAHWVAYVYTFNEELLEMLNLKVNQDTRTFKLEKIRK